MQVKMEEMIGWLMDEYPSVFHMINFDTVARVLQENDGNIAVTQLILKASLTSVKETL